MNLRDMALPDAPTGQDLFVEVMAHVTLHPEDHLQGVWMVPVTVHGVDAETTCGTYGCIAGWACAFHGMLGANGEFHRASEGYAMEAARLLGLPIYDVDADEIHAQPDGLFYEHNDIDDIFRIAAELYELDERVLRKQVGMRIEQHTPPTEGS